MSEKTLYDAFKKGFYDGITTIVAVFDLSEEDMKEKLHSRALIDSRISELYHIWMGFTK